MLQYPYNYTFQDIMKMDAVQYKKLHEYFMTNNHGTSVVHTFFSIFFTVLCALFCSLSKYNSSSILTKYIFEYNVIVLSLILAHTIFEEYIFILNFFILILIIQQVLNSHVELQYIVSNFKLQNYFESNRMHSVTIMRSLTYLITVFSILAVDFQDFPRYLAKTERYGYSLMDTGVGLFVLMSGLVHKNVNRYNYVSVMKGNTKFIAVLLLLGYVRYMSVKQLDYQEHITEYGVHWNFFYTLAVCKLSASIILYFSNRPLTISIITLIFHEILVCLYLENWVFSDAPRISLLAANREGISSCLGYISLYLFAAYLKIILTDRSVFRYEIFSKLIFISILLWIMSYFTNIYRPTSRTLANVGYCLYLEGILTTVMCIMYFYEIVFHTKKQNVHFSVPSILSVVNDNGLVYFLIANLFTGIINMSWRTLSLDTNVVLIILNVYMITTLLLVAFLSKIGLK